MKNVIINGKANKEKVELAKSLRKNMTEAEKILWKELKANQLLGFHFRRQQVILGFIVDFYCHRKLLIIEVDGSVHELQTEYDSERVSILEQNGFSLLRFSNREVMEELELVLERIRERLRG